MYQKPIREKSEVSLVFNKDKISELEFKFEPYYDEISKVKGEVPYKGANRCTNCGRCVTVCPNSARKLDFPNMSVDKELCQSCGMCIKICTTGALTAAVSKQTEKHRTL
jgi:dihydroorotate dehydrogenase (fumarate)